MPVLLSKLRHCRLMILLSFECPLKRSQAVMGSQGQLGVRLVPARPVTRSQTPKLATKTRAAAHPAPAQHPLPAPKQRASFRPGKLTVPQSPAFATRSRLRAQVFETLVSTRRSGCLPLLLPAFKLQCRGTLPCQLLAPLGVCQGVTLRYSKSDVCSCDSLILGDY